MAISILIGIMLVSIHLMDYRLHRQRQIITHVVKCHWFIVGKFIHVRPHVNRLANIHCHTAIRTLILIIIQPHGHNIQRLASQIPLSLPCYSEHSLHQRQQLMPVIVGSFSHQTQWYPFFQRLSCSVEHFCIARQLVSAIPYAIHRTDFKPCQEKPCYWFAEYIGSCQKNYRPIQHHQHHQGIHHRVLVTRGKNIMFPLWNIFFAFHHHLAVMAPSSVPHYRKEKCIKKVKICQTFFHTAKIQNIFDIYELFV